MDELAMMMQRGGQESGKAYRSPMDALNPEMMGNHRRARETVVLADPVSWSINNAAVNHPGSTSQINISNKGVLDLRKSYLEFIVDGLGENRIFYPNIFEVVSFSMGSNLQV